MEAFMCNWKAVVSWIFPSDVQNIYFWTDKKKKSFFLNIYKMLSIASLITPAPSLCFLPQVLIKA